MNQKRQEERNKFHSKVDVEALQKLRTYTY
jgi:hypothetical protein